LTILQESEKTRFKNQGIDSEPPRFPNQNRQKTPLKPEFFLSLKSYLFKATFNLYEEQLERTIKKIFAIEKSGISTE
jgi:hypothetical protein